jgi:nucleotide-binding universal stress UspA family protein
MYKHILVPTDGSKLSAKAVKQAIQFAKSIGATVTAIHVSNEFRAMMDEGFAVPAFPAIKKRFEEETAKRSKALLESVKSGAQTAGVECNCVSVTNDFPYDAIIKQAKKSKCDLIMMASHGRKGLSSILLGSETAKVLTHSTIPVLVVR